ncbi:cyclase family protein [Mycobacterium sp. 1423905.2]|uniref:cyclase family protein n=1 Tax=Mycobacterium sp. 1423905.2 TaxID=1856859 RepID=UPI0007FE4082|nr:cyclase family protein [Mycobacterium sp. 1423905.2]OBJ47321.1 cyclase [Mycobacterium sp. 1423905.2]
MASLNEFRRVARDVSNWGRWGAQDELGTLNFITDEKVQQAASLVRHGKVFALGVDFGSSGPQGAFQFRHNPILVMTVDGGDANTLAQYGPAWTRNPTAKQVGGYLVDNLFRFNEDMIIMPLQAATQWDALSHVYYEDKLYNGFPATSVTSMGAYHCGIDKVDVKGITSRGVLLDVVRHRGAEVFLEQGNPITPEELDDVARGQGVTIQRGDIVLVRTGWWTRYGQTGNKTEPFSGLHWRCAAWLHDHEVAAVASDNLQVEDLVPDVEGAFLPLHLLCLRDMGMMLGEYWDFTALAQDCAADGVYEFQLIAPPMRFVGAVGSPVNPIAIK